GADDVARLGAMPMADLQAKALHRQVREIAQRPWGSAGSGPGRLRRSARLAGPCPRRRGGLALGQQQRPVSLCQAGQRGGDATRRDAVLLFVLADQLLVELEVFRQRSADALLEAGNALSVDVRGGRDG